MWLTLLKEKVDAVGSSITKVAAQLRYSRTTVSLVLDGKYPGSTDRIAARVLEVFGRIQCPHLGDEIGRADCHANRSRNVPTSSPRAMQHWRACQACETGKQLTREEKPS